MKLQDGAIIAAHAGFLGTIYSYTSSEGVNAMVCSLFYATLPDKRKKTGEPSQFRKDLYVQNQTRCTKFLALNILYWKIWNLFNAK